MAEQGWLDFERIFAHLSKYSIILCRSCQYAVPPQQISSHLQAHHKGINIAVRRSIEEHVESLDYVAWTKEAVCYPPSGGPAIEGLEVHCNGWECTGNLKTPGCGYVCQTKQGMQSHCREEHQWNTGKARGG